MSSHLLYVSIHILCYNLLHPLFAAHGRNHTHWGNKKSKILMKFSKTFRSNAEFLCLFFFTWTVIIQYYNYKSSRNSFIFLHFNSTIICQRLEKVRLSTNLKHPASRKFLGWKTGHVQGKQEIWYSYLLWYIFPWHAHNKKFSQHFNVTFENKDAMGGRTSCTEAEHNYKKDKYLLLTLFYTKVLVQCHNHNPLWTPLRISPLPA